MGTSATGQTSIGQINSITCPEAWAFLYRLCRDGEKKQVPQEILEAWRSGGQARNKLLSDFVRRVFNKEHDYASNRARLECLVKLRQASKDWRTNLQGFEWLTEAEMKERGWSENLAGVLSSIFAFLGSSWLSFSG